MNHKCMVQALRGNQQRLDGGAMFGNVPKALWAKWLVPDDQNRVTLACRCLLLRNSGRNILFETGIGAFFEPKLRERFGVDSADHELLLSLGQQGLRPQDIDVVVLSHLHFDHAGGLLAAFDGGPLRLAFPRAQFIVGRAAWQRALTPHARDRASFIPGLTDLLQGSGRLRLVDASDAPEVLGPGFAFHLSEGHTPGLLLTEVPLVTGPLVFASDLIPGAPWVHLPVTMGYDRFPEALIDEKSRLLTSLVERGGSLFFTHDPQVEVGRVVRDQVNQRFSVTPTTLTAMNATILAAEGGSH